MRRTYPKTMNLVPRPEQLVTEMQKGQGDHRLPALREVVTVLHCKVLGFELYQVGLDQ